MKLKDINVNYRDISKGNRMLYPLSNDPSMQRKLYWTEEFDEEFNNANGAKTNNMKPNFPTFKNDNADVYTVNYSGPSGEDISKSLDLTKDLLSWIKYGKGGPPTPTPSGSGNQGGGGTPPPPPPEKSGWSTGAIIGASVGGAVLVGLGVVLVIRAFRK